MMVLAKDGFHFQIQDNEESTVYRIVACKDARFGIFDMAVNWTRGDLPHAEVAKAVKFIVEDLKAFKKTAKKMGWDGNV